jgi:hypothetical protein
MFKQLLVSVVLVATVAPYAVASDNTDWMKDEGGTGDGTAKKVDWIKDTSGIGQSKEGQVRSDQILELGTCPPSALQLEGEHAMRIGNIDTALTVLQRAVEMAPLDMEKRLLYAQCLEKKLMAQKKKDPALYNFLIKQYLFIYRKAEFIDQTMIAKQALVHLTGTAPRSVEKSEKFLTRVLIPEDGSEKVAVSKRQPASPQ